MHVRQHHWSATEGWLGTPPADLPRRAGLVLVFGATSLLRGAAPLAEVRAAFPEAVVVGCSTAGEIEDVRVYDDSVVVTAIGFDNTIVRGTQLECPTPEDSAGVGRRLGQQLSADDLAHVLLFSSGLGVNGSDLVCGLCSALPDGVTATGGLAGDGEAFRDTCAFLGAPRENGTVVAVGLYGRHLQVGYASLGGWDPFGPERLITSSHRNVLYELDGRSALGLYKRYLGEYAADLPASALLFPLSLRTPDGGTGIVRTVLAVDDDAQSMTFAGDVPEGSYARFMKANFERRRHERRPHERRGRGRRAGRVRAPHQLRGPPDGAQAARRGGDRARARGPGPTSHADGLLLIRGDFAVHAEGPLRVAQPDHDNHDPGGARRCMNSFAAS